MKAHLERTAQKSCQFTSNFIPSKSKNIKGGLLANKLVNCFIAKLISRLVNLNKKNKVETRACNDRIWCSTVNTAWLMFPNGALCARLVAVSVSRLLPCLLLHLLHCRKRCGNQLYFHVITGLCLCVVGCSMQNALHEENYTYLKHNCSSWFFFFLPCFRVRSWGEWPLHKCIPYITITFKRV